MCCKLPVLPVCLSVRLQYTIIISSCIANLLYSVIDSLFIVATIIIGGGVWSLFCNTVRIVLLSFTIASLRNSGNFTLLVFLLLYSC